jgi:hypothetical protein
MMLLIEFKVALTFRWDSGVCTLGPRGIEYIAMIDQNFESNTPKDQTVVEWDILSDGGTVLLDVVI